MDGQVSHLSDRALHGGKVDGHEVVQGKAAEGVRRRHGESHHGESRQRLADRLGQKSVHEIVEVGGKPAAQLLEAAHHGGQMRSSTQESGGYKFEDGQLLDDLLWHCRRWWPGGDDPVGRHCAGHHRRAMPLQLAAIFVKSSKSTSQTT